MSAHWDEDERSNRPDPRFTTPTPVPRREITDEMLKARIRQERAKKELAEARAALEELERPEREAKRQQELAEIKMNDETLLAFSEELVRLCAELNVQILADHEYDAVVPVIRCGTGSTEVEYRVSSDGAVFR